MLSDIHKYYDDKYEQAVSLKEKYDVEKTRSMVIAYAQHYANDGYKTVALEMPFEMPLCDPNTGEPIEGETYNGIIDWVVEKDGKIGFCDHKTASRVDNNYWLALRGDAQISHYSMFARQSGVDLDFFLWDLILKPGISPKDITKTARNELEDFGTYLDMPYRYDDWRDSKKETPKMYGMRVLLEYTNNPERYFLRREVHRNFDDIIGWLSDLSVVSTAMNRTDTEDKAIRNRSHCKAYGSLCEFHGMCFGDRSGYREKPDGQSPFSPKSRSVSSVSDFMNCRRKWYYKKVARLEREEEEYQESLAVGTMFHEGLEIFLKSRPSSVSVDFTGNLYTGDGNAGI